MIILIGQQLSVIPVGVIFGNSYIREISLNEQNPLITIRFTGAIILNGNELSFNKI